jgi:hypothetical protein
MPILMHIVCDGCGAVKKEANHWYTLEFLESAEATVRPMAMSALRSESTALKYYCGRRCVVESLDRWMDRLPLATAHTSDNAA